MIWLRSFLLLLVLLPLALPAAFAGELTQDVAAQLRYLLGPAFDTPSRILDGQPVPLTRPLMRFYRERDFAPAWIDDHGISPLAGAVLDVLERVDEDGLRPGDYAVAPLRSQLEGFRDDPAPERAKVTRLAEFDLLLSRAFIDYAVDQTSGRVDPETLAPDWEARPRRIDPARLLQFALQPDRMSRVLVDLPPPHAGYRRLKRALADYRRLARLPWPELADGPVVRPGEHDSRLPAVRRILTLLGDLQPQLLVEEPGFYDSTTAEAVRAFQRRHGLAADGLIGGMTLTALRVPPAVRVRQIMLNLERWRWLPKDLGARHLLVNIAGFELEAVEPGQPALHMEVVVGKDYRQTPVFSARVRYLQFAPSWYVPPTILLACPPQR